MDPFQALEILKQAVPNIQTTLQQHQLIQRALATINAVFYPQDQGPQMQGQEAPQNGAEAPTAEVELTDVMAAAESGPPTEG